MGTARAADGGARQFRGRAMAEVLSVGMAVAGTGDAEVSLADGYWAVLVGTAAEESARTGPPVDLRGRGP